jgi:major membrane immunogen (membrane-anchored lipoprotein)
MNISYLLPYTIALLILFLSPNHVSLSSSQSINSTHDDQKIIAQKNVEITTKKGTLPPGVYKESCKKITVEGDILEALCQRRDGTWRYTQINFRNCKGDIWNDDGFLNCRHRYSLPPGSYQKDCTELIVEGNTLRAKCKRADGVWKYSSINYKNCVGDIWNENGTLRCKEKSYSKLPKGPYKKTCKNFIVNDYNLQAQCQKNDGSWTNASIYFKHCEGEIWNYNGRLKCQ